MEVGGKLIEGAQNIFFAQLADPSVEHFAVSATRFMSGKFPLMIFGLPGAALAMYRTAKPEKRKAVAGLLLSAALTSMLTGITEPIEFTFLFVAPVLYIIHCVFAGLAYMLMHVFNVGVGMTFSGGLIDMFLFGILQGNKKTSWIWIVIVGIGYFVVYYFLFSFLIKKFNFKTPGREDNDDEVKLYTRKDVEAKKNGGKAADGAHVEGELSAQICAGLGGKKNISDVDCCATRLRCTVFEAAKVNDALLKAPADGEISFIFPTHHAIGFVTADGMEMLLHIGIDTVKLNGEGFEILVEEGAKVKKGDALMKIDLDYVKSHAPSLVSPILCTDLKENEKVRLLKTGAVKAGEDLFAVDIYE